MGLMSQLITTIRNERGNTKQSKHVSWVSTGAHESPMSADIVGRHWWLVSAVIWPPKMSADKANATWQMSADKVGLYVLGADIDGWHHLTWNDSSQHCCINPTAIKGMEWKKEYYLLLPVYVCHCKILHFICYSLWLLSYCDGTWLSTTTADSGVQHYTDDAR